MMRLSATHLLYQQDYLHAKLSHLSHQRCGSNRTDRTGAEHHALTRAGKRVLFLEAREYLDVAQYSGEIGRIRGMLLAIESV